MKGIYLLFLHLEGPVKKEIGQLGKINFELGTYIYVGSAQRGIESRVKRHLREDKRKHWHIDYLLENASVEDMIGYEEKKKEECKTASFLERKFKKIEGFGCSDCRCDSHLFHSKRNLENIIDSIREFKGEEDLRLRAFESQ
ncbi:MAG: GIY-YIG nuclease family protein [Candidatus Thermoplasmatota archaeon]